MNAFTRIDLSLLKARVAQGEPAERLVIHKWDKVLFQMDVASKADTIRGLKIVIFAAKKAQSVLVDEVKFRGLEPILRAMDQLDSIRKEAQDLVRLLEGS